MEIQNDGQTDAFAVNITSVVAIVKHLTVNISHQVLECVVNDDSQHTKLCYHMHVNICLAYHYIH